MSQRKLVTTLSLLGLPFVAVACQSDLDDCRITRSCPTPPGGKGGSAGSAGSAAGSKAAGSAGSVGSAGSTAAGGSSGDAGAASGGASGEGGGDPSGAGDAGQGTSGTGGYAGGSGEGGEAGRPDSPECEEDNDCDDHLFCNGRETCDAGTCQTAQPPCENRDAAHCSMSCEEGEDQANCVFEAIDADEDEHGTAACEAAPGGDCDDENDQLHPGAAEACDGIDNDCDGLADLEDGLTLAGENESATGIGELDLAWLAGAAEVPAQFRMLFTQANPAGIFSAVLDSSGALDANHQRAVAPNGNRLDDVHVAGGTTTFGITYQSTGVGGGDAYVLQTDRSGATSLERTVAVGDLNDIARRESADWIVGVDQNPGIRMSRYLQDGTVLPGPTVTFGGQPAAQVSWLRVAAQGDESAVIWQVNPNLLRWARLSSSLVASDGVSVGATGHRPDIAATETGYAMAWATGSGIGFMRYATNGNALCEHGLVDLGLDAMGDQHRVALADTEFGTLVLVTSEEGKVSLVRFDEDCQTTGIVPVANTASAGSPALAVGGGSVALAWVNRGASIAHTRLAGERLCE